MDRSNDTPYEPIAIVGIGCRFPGAESPGAFWDLLCGGVDALGTIPSDRTLLLEASRAKRSRDRIPELGGYLRDIESFDAGFFGFSGVEASVTDPQQRMLCEVVWEAFEDGGLDPKTLRGRPIGVAVGSLPSDFQSLTVSRPSQWDLYSAVNTAPSSLSGRVAHAFGFEGGALSIDAACASSLLAVHLACSAIHAGEMEMAVAAGVNLILLPSHSSPFTRAGMLAADGRCKAFDARGDGFVQSEGIAAVILKPLNRALEDGDPIYAAIRGSLSNHDGDTGQYKTPNRIGQETLLQRTYQRAGIDPNSVDYVEAHGTGTTVGDPVEAGALSSVLCSGRSSDHPLRIGSVKTNIGHTEGAAGLAGLIKLALSLEHGVLPPSLNFETPNPSIPWDELPLRVQTELTPWPRKGALGLGGVSAFGLSGVNCHAILEEVRDNEEVPTPDPKKKLDKKIDTHVIVTSGSSPQARRDNLLVLQGILEDTTSDLEDVCYTLATRRSHFDYRAMIQGKTRDELREGIDTLLNGELTPQSTMSDLPALASPRVVFCFPGQGAQWEGMARKLIGVDRAFTAELQRCDEVIRAEAGFSVLEALKASPQDPSLKDIAHLQPTLFAIQVSLVASWAALGIQADAVIGHSMGEVAASHVAGLLSLEDAAAVICRRSRLMRSLIGQGAMLVVELSREEAEAMAVEEPLVSLAVQNSPTQAVLSGDVASIQRIQSRLEEREVFTRLVNVDVASHSPQMEPIRDALLAELESLRPQNGRLPFYSTVGSERGETPRFDSEYWWNNLRDPVLFADTVKELIEDQHQLFVEISPHPLLCQAISQSPAATASTVALPSMKREEDEREVLLSSLAELYLRGVQPDWVSLTGEKRFCRLPGYQWQHETFAIDYSREAVSGTELSAAATSHPLVAARWSSAECPNTHVFETEIDLDQLPWLRDHQVQGEVVFPGAGYVEMALAAGRLMYGAPVTLEGLSFGQALFLNDETSSRIQLVASKGGGEARFSIYSLSPSGEMVAKLSEGRMKTDNETRGADGVLSLDADVQGLEPENRKAFYERMTSIGLEYGPAFQGVSEAAFTEGQGWTRLELSDVVREDIELYQIHPALLDAVMQSMSTAFGAGFDTTYLPVGFGRVVLHEASGSEAARVQVRSLVCENPNELLADIALFDENGQLVLTLSEVRAARLERQANRRLEAECMHQTVWREQELGEPSTSSPRTWLLLGGEAKLALAQRLEDDGSIVHTVDVLTKESLQAFHDQANENPRGVLFVAPQPEKSSDAIDADAMEQSTKDVCLPLVTLIQLAAETDTPLGRVWIVTEGASGFECDPRSIPQAAASGLVRVLAVEHPECSPTLLDVTGTESERAEIIRTEALADSPDNHIVVRGEERYVARLVRSEPGRLGSTTSSLPATGRAFRLTVLDDGSLGVQRFRGQSVGTLQVEVEVVAATVLPSDLERMRDTQSQGGLAFSGRIRSLGSRVSDYSVGDEVIGTVDGLCSSVVLDASNLWRKPEGLTFEEAALVPLTYGVAAYALDDSRLEAGRLYVDDSSSGLGAALTLLAKARGFELSNDDADIALLSSPSRLESVREALRPFGRLLELRTDNTPFDAAVRIPIDAEALVTHRPRGFVEAMDEVLSELDAGTLTKPNVKSLSLSNPDALADQLRHGSEANPFVVRLEIEQTTLSPGGPRLSSDGTYLITGGLGGLGLCIAEEMSEQGAANFILCGRSAPSENARAVIDRMEERGVRVEVASLDVTDEAALKQVLARCGEDLPTLRGVVHAAGTLSDATLLNLKEEDFDRVFATKVRGTWNLHRNTESLDLDFFVVFSSAAAVVGSPGQANYAAANAFMDGLMRLRRERGCPSYSIQWGAWSEVGLAATPDRGGRLEMMGLFSMSPSEGSSLFMRAIEREPAEVALVSFDLAQWEKALPQVRKDRFLDELRTQSSATVGGDEQLRSEVLALSLAQERLDFIADRLTALVAETLKIRKEAIDPNRSILSLGMDSLMSVEIRNRVESMFAVSIPVTALLKGPSLRELAERVLSQIVDGASEEESTASEEASDAFPWSEDLDLDSELYPQSPVDDSTSPKRFLLTGATGFVGSFVLDELLKAGAADVYCLVRGRNLEGARKRLQESLLERGLWKEEFESRVHVVLGDLSRKRLGLSKTRFARLAETVDEVVHVGAHVNFFLPYPSLRAANVLATKELLRFCATGSLKPMHFTSTYAVHMRTLAEGDEAIEDGLPTSLPEGGYCQTKYASEVVLEEARRRGFIVNIYRPGLVAWHSETGVFNDRELVARLISSAIEMGLAPDAPIQIHMTPVERVAQAMVRLIGDREARGGNYHVTAPRPRLWTEVVQTLKELGHDLELVSVEEWLAVVSAAEGEGESAAFAAAFLPSLADGEGMDFESLRKRQDGGDEVDTRRLRERLGYDLEPSDLKTLDAFIECRRSRHAG